jgi:hypothetical protein
MQQLYRTSHKRTFHYISLYNNFVYIIFWIIFMLSVVANKVNGMSEQRNNELK